MNSRYEEIEKRYGQSLAPAGVDGVAFTRPSALEAVKALRGTPFAIVGGDIYRTGDGGLRLTYDNWFTERAPEEDSVAFQSRSLAAASQYIKNYKEKEEGTTLYALVLKKQ